MASLITAAPLLQAGMGSRYHRKHKKSKKCVVPGCRQENVTPETRKMFLKGLLVWGLFSLGSHLYLTRDVFVIILHCVGFGFFLTITTRKTRWLGAVAVGAVAFIIATYQLIPQEWIIFSFNVTGYTGLVGVFIVGVACRAVQKREMILRSEFLRSLVSMGSRYFQIPFADQKEESAERVLMRIEKTKLCKFLIEVDSRLVETEETIKQLNSQSAKLEAANARLRTVAEKEVARRLQVEKLLSNREEKIVVLKKEFEKQTSQMESLRRMLNDTRARLQRTEKSVVVEQ